MFADGELEDFKKRADIDKKSGSQVLSAQARAPWNIQKAHWSDKIVYNAWSIENAELNDVPEINFYEGDASMLGDKEYDIFIANINNF